MAIRQTTELIVKGMDCGSCAQKIEASLQPLPGIIETSVDFATGRLSASYDPLQVNEMAIRDRVTALGYTVELAPVNTERLRVKAASQMLVRRSAPMQWKRSPVAICPGFSWRG